MKKFLSLLILLFGVSVSPVDANSVKSPQFSLPSASGVITDKTFKGKVIYVDFWASWCKPCKKSFPWLNMMQQKYKDKGLVVLAINLDTDKKLADEFLKKIPANFTVAFDPEGQSAKDFKVMGMPSSYLINRKGYVIGSHVGFREKDAEALEQGVVKLLQQ